MNKLLSVLNSKITNIKATKLIQNTSITQQCKYPISIKEKIRLERQERLNREKQYFPTKTSEDVDLIRNVGIIAHIDAGKTTTTERMLYYAGALSAPGEVHDGNTVMDYMEQERERGITIRSAAISFNWRGYQFNLIDTPGHIDFTGEVERALRVLDGAVAIFDAVSGVQTQSEMVWYQSNKFQIPRLAFINKMDRQGANLESTLKSIESRLNIEPLVLQIPIGEGEDFKGIIDLTTMLEVHYVDSYGNEVKLQPLQENSKYYKQAHKYREKLLDTISLYDDQIAECILEEQEISSEQIEMSIRNILKSHSIEICPIFVGSSLKNKGIQLLMDAVIKYLPSPNEELTIKSVNSEYLIRKRQKDEQLTALAYKIINDPEKGPLTYVRVYSGELNQRQVLKNVNRDLTEKSGQLYRVRANDYVSTKSIGAGDIAAIQGLKSVMAGDTLLEEKDMDDFLLEELKMPQPVFMAAIEYESLKDKTPLENALKTIAREDNSFQFKEDKETGQLIGMGLGELHLEVIKDRIESEFKIKATLGKMRVTYREGIQDSYELNYTYEKMIGSKPAYINLDLQIEPLEEEHESEQSLIQNKIEMDFERDPEFDFYYREFKRREAVAARAKDNQIVDLVMEDSSDKSGLSEQLQNMRFIKNPVKHTEIDKLEDEFGEVPLYHISSMSFELLYKLEQTIANGLSKGCLLNYPMTGVKVKVTDGKFSLKRTNEIVVQQAAAEMIDEMVQNSSPILLEPIMDVEVSSPSVYQKEVMNDIIKGRRGKVSEINEETSKFGSDISDRNTILSEIPLIETVGYCSYLRSISKGEASFIMKFKKFDYVGGQKQKQLIDGSSFF